MPQFERGRGQQCLLNAAKSQGTTAFPLMNFNNSATSLANKKLSEKKVSVKLRDFKLRDFKNQKHLRSYVQYVVQYVICGM